MKQAADALRAIGHPVDDSTFVLNLLRGANSRYSTTADLIAATPNITFATALDQLALKELQLANEAKVAASPALVASTPSGCGSNCRSPSMSSGQQQGLGSSGGGSQQQQGKRKKGNGKRTGGGGGGSQQQGWGGGGWGGQQRLPAPSPTGPWICFNPWTMPQRGLAGGPSGGQTWRGALGLLGPGLQAHTTFGSPAQQSTLFLGAS